MTKLINMYTVHVFSCQANVSKKLVVNSNMSEEGIGTMDIETVTVRSFWDVSKNSFLMSYLKLILFILCLGLYVTK